MFNYEKIKLYVISANGLNYITSSTAIFYKRRLGIYAYFKNRYNILAISSQYPLFDYPDCKITLIDLPPCKTQDEWIERKNHYIKTTDCINKYILTKPEKLKPPEKVIIEEIKTPEMIKKEKRRLYYLKTKERVKEQHRLYYINNKETIVEKRKIFYFKNKEKINKKHKIYNEENKKQLTKLAKRYSKKHRKEINEKAREVYFFKTKVYI
jgi:hypothetical protein